MTTLASPDDTEIQQAVDSVIEHKLEEIKAMPLIERLWHMQTELGRVGKHGKNESQNYAYLRESDLVADIVKLGAKYRVFITFRQDVEYTEILTLTSAQGKPMTGTSVKQLYEIFNIDDPEDTLSRLLKTELSSQGYSADTGDKSLYKAKTGAKKYALTDTFMVSSGDDPELAGAGDGAPDGRRQQPPRGGSAPRPQRDEGPATEEQVKLWVSRKKSYGIKSVAAIASIGKAIGTSVNLAPGDVTAFLRTLSHRNMGKALAELDKIKPPQAASPASPATTAPASTPSDQPQPAASASVAPAQGRVPSAE